MNKKGFTLMELLAVIVILAVLALLVIPITTNLIKTSKKEAFRISVGQVSDNIYFHYASDWILSGMNENKVFNFETEENLNLLTVSGKLPTSGTITINPQGKIDINVNNGVYCAVKTIDQDKIQVGEIIDGVCEITGAEVDSCAYRVGKTWNFDYISTGEDRSQEFSIPCEGNYKLEVWGASGAGTNAGFGGYSTGEILMSELDKLYINVGGKGNDRNVNIGGTGGYNGGGNGSNAYSSYNAGTGGGGATHIALESGLLSSFESKINKIIIVAGGGGGVDGFNETAGSGGGISGGIGLNAGNGSSTAGNQTTGYQFGIGGPGTAGTSYGGSGEGNGGSGGGLYGGYTITNRNNSSTNTSGAGGSGYIGYSNLKNKYMYCYNCTTSTDESTYTITGKSVKDEAASTTAKQGNGYARITYLGKKQNTSVIACTKGVTYEFDYMETEGNGVEQTFTPTCTGYYKLEVWGAQGGSVATNYQGGYGGYSKGLIRLTKDNPIYINVGGQGKTASGSKIAAAGGYNGGGSGYTDGSGSYTRYAGGGGGATHIALSSGLLTTFDPSLANNKHGDLLIVAGGGGGTWFIGSSSNWETRQSGHGGGFKGVTGSAVETGNYSYAPGGTQDTGFAFGQGRNVTDGAGGGGGGGYYGGEQSSSFGAGGGSGYLSSTLLNSKYMYCYECESSGEYSTISTQNVSSYPISRYAKKGNGYVKITYMGDKNDSSFQNELGDSFVYGYKEENGSGVEQTFTVPVTGVYRLEVWGGQGGSYSSYLGGTGGYSVGEIELQKDRTLYINVGGAGDSLTTVGSGYLYGGYNGGGYGYSGDSYNYVTGGGGATHIAFATGLLTAFDSTLENSIHDQLIIVAGGGGSAFYHTNGRYGHGGHGGGYIGSSGTTNTSATLPTGGTQSSGGLGDGSGTFGKGADSGWGNGGGGGYYGGGAAVTGTPNVAYNYTGAGGGSGYIGNNALSNKHMYCYNCTTSPATNENTYTISDGTNSCKNQSPLANCAKQGDGFARITLIEIK